MRLSKKIRLRLTEGEQSFLLALFGVAFFGAGLSFMIVTQLGGASTILRPLSGYDIWTITAGTSGASLGFYLSRDWFGHPGFTGFGLALLGIIVVSFLSSIIGGTFALPFYGTMFGPFTLAVTLIGAPMLAFFWVAILLSSHALLTVWRRERDSIFVTQEDEDDGVPA